MASLVLVELNELLSVDGTLQKLGPRTLEAVAELTRAFRQPENRTVASQDLFVTLTHLLRLITQVSTDVSSIELAESELIAGKTKGGAVVSTLLPLAAETVRCLRNLCVECLRNQNFCRTTGALEEAIKLLLILLGLPPDVGDEILFVALRCSIQFLGNAAVGNVQNQCTVWSAAFPDLLLRCLLLSDSKAVDYCCMLLHTCFNTSRVNTLASNSSGLPLARAILDVCHTHPELEWPLLLVTQHVLPSSFFIPTIYQDLNHRQRLTVLEVLEVQLDEPPEKELSLPPSLLLLLPWQLRQCGTALLQLLAQAADRESISEDVVELQRVLRCLCRATAQPGRFPDLLDHPDILPCALELLHATSEAEKQNGALYCTDKADYSVASRQLDQGFKCEMVRLVGNLCYENKTNQDKIRELDGIPLILDSTSIDDNNPFLEQWAVLAIHNLTEHNLENQAVLAAMKRQGFAPGVDALRGLGVEVEEREGRLYFKTTKKPPST
uniref:ataxin-10-like isoform X1 n=1 Tax=Myxine glutinosa TaxID=7769 RepID=UPI0035901962